MNISVDFTGETKLVGLLGSPVAHSMSPALHTASFSKLGINAVYLGFDVRPEQLPSAVRGLVELGAIGYNVTMPCKTYIGEYLDELSTSASLMGAVNTVVIKEGRSIGHNTDGAGFIRNLRNLGHEPEHKIATVAGAGGAGSAIFTELALEKAAEIRIFNLHDAFWEKTQAHLSRIAQATGAKLTLHDLEDRALLKTSIAESYFFVNATRVGMAPDVDACLIDENMLHDNLFVADTVYEPHETKLITMAKSHGLPTAGGLGMLLHQAALAEKLWFDKDMPIDYIEETFFH